MALGALVVLSLIRLRQRQALLQAAEIAREALTTARRNALERGAVFQFRYEPGGRRLLVIPDYDWLAMTVGTHAGGAAGAESPTRPPDATASDTLASGDPLQEAATAAELFLLPEPFAVAASSSETVLAPAATGERLPEDWFTGLPDASRLAEVTWSPSVRFFPDGRGDPATFAVTDGQQRIVVSVRSLTGQVRLSPIEFVRR